MSKPAELFSPNLFRDPSDASLMDQGVTFGFGEAEGKQLEIVERKHLARGSDSTIEEVVIRVTNRGKTRDIEMVLKTFEQPEKAAEAFTKYERLKEVGLRVFKTYRINPQAGEILMTNGNKDERFCLSANGPPEANLDVTVETFGLERLDRIVNLDGLMDDLDEEILKASRGGVVLHSHAYFFIIDKNRPGYVDFVVGDSENSDIDEYEDSEIDKKNASNIRDALESFIWHNVIEDNGVSVRYIEAVHKFFNHRSLA